MARTASRSEAWVATRMGPGAPNASGPSSRVTNVTDDPAVVAMRPNAEPTRPLPTTVNDGGGGGEDDSASLGRAGEEDRAVDDARRGGAEPEANDDARAVGVIFAARETPRRAKTSRRRSP